jgi:hypothetical protein
MEGKVNFLLCQLINLVGWWVRTAHVLLLLELDEGIAPAFALFVLDKSHPFDRAVLLKVPLEPALAGIVGHSRYKEGFVGVRSRFGILVRIPCSAK